jgi:chromosome condensin MukBEF ATPase and DNA-binding subunit MukB
MGTLMGEGREAHKCLFGDIKGVGLVDFFHLYDFRPSLWDIGAYISVYPSHSHRSQLYRVVHSLHGSIKDIRKYPRPW